MSQKLSETLSKTMQKIAFLVGAIGFVFLFSQGCSPAFIPNELAQIDESSFGLDIKAEKSIEIVGVSKIEEVFQGLFG
jgi:hypothetical protein